MKNSMVKRITICLGMFEAMLIIAAAVFLISVSRYEVKETVAKADDTTEEPTRDIIDQHIYELDEINESLLGKKIALVGFMCNEVGTDTSAAWLYDKPFMSKDEVVGELRIDTGNIIAYTPYPIEVIGRVVADTQIDGDALTIKIAEAEIYHYGGGAEKYKRIGDIIEAGVIEHIVLANEEILSGEYDEESKTQLRTDLETCNELGEDKFVTLLTSMIEYDCDDASDSIAYENVQALLLEAIYETGDSEGNDEDTEQSED